MSWIQGFINPRILYLPRPEAEENISFLGKWILVSIELKVVNCFIIWHILYVAFILKISFYHDVFFGFFDSRNLFAVLKAGGLAL